jgi:hypothetical protein
MSGPKLDTVKGALRYLSTYYTPADSLALVTFDDVVETRLDITTTDDAGLSLFTSKVNQIITGGMTAFDAALTTGIELANKMAKASKNRVVRIIILTDGRANGGVTDPEVIVSRLKSMHKGVSLSTIGVGTDCNHDLLGQLATAGSGSYGFVENHEQAAEVLGAEIGGLVNLDASQVEVSVLSKDTYATIADPLAIDARRDNGSIVVSLGNLVAGQTRNLVFPVTLKCPKKAHARPVTLADVTVTGRVEEIAVTIELKPKVHFIAGPTTRDNDLDEMVDLAVLAAAQRQAEAAAIRFDFIAAEASLVDLGLSTPSSQVLLDNLVANYKDRSGYDNSQVLRNSMSAVLRPAGDLIGSSASFNSLASRTVGNYTTDAAREVALGAMSNAAQGRTWPRPGEETPPPSAPLRLGDYEPVVPDHTYTTELPYTPGIADMVPSVSDAVPSVSNAVASHQNDAIVANHLPSSLEQVAAQCWDSTSASPLSTPQDTTGSPPIDSPVSGTAGAPLGSHYVPTAVPTVTIPEDKDTIEDEQP